MVLTPDVMAKQYIDAGCSRLIVHAEACPHLHRTLGNINSIGRPAAVALNPATPASAIEHVLDLVDLVLVMTVNPGFGGQAYMPTMEPKITEVRRMLDDAGLGRHGRRRGRRRDRPGDHRRCRRCRGERADRRQRPVPRPGRARSRRHRHCGRLPRRRLAPHWADDARTPSLRSGECRSALTPSAPGRALDALAGAVDRAKAGDPLAPVTVVVPTNTAGVMARRRSAARRRRRPSTW